VRTFHLVVGDDVSHDWKVTRFFFWNAVQHRFYHHHHYEVPFCVVLKKVKMRNENSQSKKQLIV